jgi:hypothetical protein
MGCGHLLDDLSKIRRKWKNIKIVEGNLGWGVGDGLGGVYCCMSGRCCFVKV